MSIKLKELRIEKNVKQQDLAILLDITRQSYSRYELGIAEPNIESLIKLANYFDVSLDYLVGREFNNEFGYLDDTEKNLLSLFRQMTKENKEIYFQEGRGILLAQNFKI